MTGNNYSLSKLSHGAYRPINQQDGVTEEGINIQRLKRLSRYQQIKKPMFSIGKDVSIPHTARYSANQRSVDAPYRCQCCNDSGIVEPWKLNAAWPDHFPLVDVGMAPPVFCRRFKSRGRDDKRICGDYMAQIYVDNRDKEKFSEGQEPHKRMNRFENKELLRLFDQEPNFSDDQIGADSRMQFLMCLTEVESTFVDKKIYAMRQAYATQFPYYIERIKELASKAKPIDVQQNIKRPKHGLQPIGNWLGPFNMPEDPLNVFNKYHDPEQPS